MIDFKTKNKMSSETNESTLIKSNVYVCFKRFIDGERESYPDEVLGVFSRLNKAKKFAKEFPKISMDDPDLFTVAIKKCKINRTIWGKW